MGEPHAKEKGGNGRTLLLLAGVVGLLFLASAVLGALRLRDSARSLANKKSVLFVGECIGSLRSTGERDPCGAPRTKIVVAGRDETREGDLRALDSGSRVSITVEATSDDGASVGCKIDLLGYRRTLVQKKGRDSVTCDATVP